MVSSEAAIMPIPEKKLSTLNQRDPFKLSVFCMRSFSKILANFYKIELSTNSIVCQ